ncbi:AMP-binding protein, partial [Pseudomonadales bacterium]|nr:AMP-binding protein [Pseudomonadales bacterium]
MNLVSVLFKNSISFSNRPAIIDSSLPKEKNTFSFSALAKLTKEYIYIFQSKGLTKNSIAIICMDNSVEYVAALYACWSLGVIVAPMHSQSKPHE